MSGTGAAWREGLPPAVEDLFVDADHIDVKTAVGKPSLRQFVAAAMSWQPAWAQLLFRAREVLARLLRLDHPDMPPVPTMRLRPDEVSFAPGAGIWFFTVIAGVDGHYIVLEAADNHLTGVLAIVCEPAASTPGENRFQVITVVRHHRWTGRLYFAVVRPFHHLVVASMTRAAAALLQEEH